MASWQSKVLANTIRTTRFFVHDLKSGDERKIRSLYEITRHIFSIPKGVKFEDFQIGNIESLWIEPEGSSSEKVIYYLHGGGYFMGSLKTHRHLMVRLAILAKARLLAINYRLAPENPFPAALEDAKNAYLWLVMSKYMPKKIILAGDSAGGGLAMSLVIDLRDNHFLLPKGMLLMSPWVDLALTGESLQTATQSDPMFKLSQLKFAAKLYCGEFDPIEPLISPLYANLQGLPPTLIQVSQSELLFSDSNRLAEKMKSAGVNATLDAWDKMVHVWQYFAGFVPEGKRALMKAAEFINSI